MKSSLTMYQQKWKAKQLTRGYHGDWIQENKFKKNYLPDGLPPIVGNLNRNGGGSGKAGEEEERVPLASLMFVEVEKRLDTVVFRCCFADSVARARMMVVHGKVRVNGKIVSFFFFFYYYYCFLFFSRYLSFLDLYGRVFYKNH